MKTSPLTEFQRGILTAGIITAITLATATQYHQDTGNYLIQERPSCEIGLQDQEKNVTAPERCKNYIKNCEDLKDCTVKKTVKKEHWKYEVSFPEETPLEIRIRKDRIPWELQFEKLQPGEHRI